MYQPISNYWYFQKETSQLIFSGNKLTGLYIMGTLVVNGLRYIGKTQLNWHYNKYFFRVNKFLGSAKLQTDDESIKAFLPEVHICWETNFWIFRNSAETSNSKKNLFPKDQKKKSLQFLAYVPISLFASMSGF